MLPLTISSLLSADDLAIIENLSARLSWKNGKETAGEVASDVKRNAQAHLAEPPGPELVKLVTERLRAHPVINAYAQPRKWSPLMLSRTNAGGGYGWHVDNAVMGRDEARLRTDLSFTIFLSDPDTYDGGALEIDTSGGHLTYREQPGDVVLYPTQFLHRVAPVTAGERLAMVGWMESAVPDARARDVLFDLENVRAELSQRHNAQSVEMLTLSKAIANLKRLWDGG